MILHVIIYLQQHYNHMHNEGAEEVPGVLEADNYPVYLLEFQLSWVTFF